MLAQFNELKNSHAEILAHEQQRLSQLRDEHERLFGALSAARSEGMAARALVPTLQGRCATLELEVQRQRKLNLQQAQQLAQGSQSEAALAAVKARLEQERARSERLRQLLVGGKASGLARRYNRLSYFWHS